MEKFSRATINYPRIGRAVDFYNRCGFKLIETPWRVSTEVFKATSPVGAVPFRCQLPPERPDILVGSAEQGLVSCMAELKPGRYVSVSPCFRDEKDDALHFRDFMKVELCVVAPSEEAASVLQLIKTAATFFEIEGLHCEAVATLEGTDLIADGIEIGSYGIRRATVQGRELLWAYGTGLAEPRFSQVLRKGIVRALQS